MKPIHLSFLILIFSVFPLFSTPAGELVFEQDRSLPLVHITVAFKNGSTTDPEHLNGLTHTMTKLMMRGTKFRTKNQIDLTLDQLGANLGAETHSEYLLFQGSVLSENVAGFLDLLAEMMTAPSFSAKELEKIKKEEISQLGDLLAQDSALARLRFDQTFFKGHPYAKANEGRIADVKNITLSDIQSQYQKLIRDQQMLVLVSGDTQATALDPFLSQMRQKRQISGPPMEPIPEFKNFPKKMRVVIFDKPGRTQTQIRIGQQGVAIRSPDLDALEIANTAFGGGGFHSILMTELRSKKGTGWTYGANSNFKVGSQPHSWKIGFFPSNANTPKAIVRTLELIKDLKEKGIRQEEFDFAKQSMLNGAGFNYNTPSKRLENTLVEKLFDLPAGYHKNQAERLKAITLEQVNTALKNFITPDQLMIGLVGTASVIKKDLARALHLPENEIEVQNYLVE